MDAGTSQETMRKSMKITILIAGIGAQFRSAYLENTREDELHDPIVV
jgi:hypothetical protein